jgi:hypothetical protein
MVNRMEESLLGISRAIMIPMISFCRKSQSRLPNETGPVRSEGVGGGGMRRRVAERLLAGKSRQCCCCWCLKCVGVGKTGRGKVCHDDEEEGGECA